MATKEQLENMMSERDQENEKLRAELEALKEEKKKAEEAREMNSKDPRRMVQIELFKDSGKYKDAVYVNVNSYNALIPRGKRVSVPYFVAKHIDEMLQQDAKTASMIRVYEEEWKESARKAGI